LDSNPETYCLKPISSTLNQFLSVRFGVSVCYERLVRISFLR